jgi:hypothetical protein
MGCTYAVGSMVGSQAFELKSVCTHFPIISLLPIKPPTLIFLSLEGRGSR